MKRLIMIALALAISIGPMLACQSHAGQTPEQACAADPTCYGAPGRP